MGTGNHRRKVLAIVLLLIPGILAAAFWPHKDPAEPLQETHAQRSPDPGESIPPFVPIPESSGLIFSQPTTPFEMLVLGKRPQASMLDFDIPPDPYEFFGEDSQPFIASFAMNDGELYTASSWNPMWWSTPGGISIGGFAGYGSVGPSGSGVSPHPIANEPSEPSDEESPQDSDLPPTQTPSAPTPTDVITPPGGVPDVLTPAEPVKPVSVPEPGTMGLLALGLLGVLTTRKRTA